LYAFGQINVFQFKIIHYGKAPASLVNKIGCFSSGIELRWFDLN
jgi:hypothetical protein